jgi:hypothetical protein
MKKSQLKEIIHNIVSRKLQESVGQKKTTYGYIMADKDTDDPTLQLIGYGNMPKSLWKKKIERYAEELLKRVKNDDWRNAAYLMEKNGVFNSSVNMMKEVFIENLNEVDVTPSVSDMAASKKAQDIQKKLATAQEKEQKALEKKRKIDKKHADFDRRNYPVMNKNDRESTKANIEVGKASEEAAKTQAELEKIKAQTSL